MVYSSHFPWRSHSLQPRLAQQTETVFFTRGPSPLRPERRCLCSGFSCRALERLGAPEDLRVEQQVGQLQAERVEGRGLKQEEEKLKHGELAWTKSKTRFWTYTCRWELQGGVGASWEACRQGEGQQWGGQASSAQASVDLVPLVLMWDKTGWRCKPER